MLRAASVVALAAASDGRIKHHHDATGRKLTYGSLTASTSVGPSTGWCSSGVGANAELWSNFLCGKSAELILAVSQDSARTLTVFTERLDGTLMRQKEFVFPESRFSNGKDFADALNGKFYDPVNNPSTYTGVKFTWNRYTTKMEFAYLDESGTLVSVSSLPNDSPPPDFIAARNVYFNPFQKINWHEMY